MMPETLANRLAAYSCSLQFEDLPEPVVHEAKRRFIDSLGTAVGAIDAGAYAIARRGAPHVPSPPGARLLGGGDSRLERATLVNRPLIPHLDCDHTYSS